ncbi:MAG TPA: N-acetylmuramoyl-L-alanine amidase [Flavitalea sp.]|nr:N-acetylmuramoyl-L-alanine amidase [Flavitalea sp.]
MKYFSSYFIAPIFLFMIGCAYNPYRSTNKDYKKQVKTLSKVIRQYPLPAIRSDSIRRSPFFAGTTNLNLRRPNFVIIHHTAQNSCPQTLHTFTLPRTQVSAHYVICKDGTVYQMLNDYLRAWHAGVSRWGNITDINSSSIGIELDNNGFEPFTGSQIQNLFVVLDTLKKRYNIPVANFIGHADIAPTRKNDPNVSFPWKQLAERGFGYWYDDTTGVVVPDNFSHLQALRIIGYDIRDSTAAIRAFRRHFIQDTIPGLKDEDKKILYLVSKKYE